MAASSARLAAAAASDCANSRPRRQSSTAAILMVLAARSALPTSCHQASLSNRSSEAGAGSDPAAIDDVALIGAAARFVGGEEEYRLGDIGRHQAALEALPRQQFLLCFR